MKTISSWDDLRPFGIIALTGEACGLSYRLLCDLTAKGRAILQKCLGLPDLCLAAPWNRGSQDDPHTGSIMLAPEMFIAVAVFSLLESGCKEVWRVDDGLVGIEANDDPQALESLKRWHGGRLLRRYGYFGTAGDRNVHQMSGRVY